MARSVLAFLDAPPDLTEHGVELRPLQRSLFEQLFCESVDGFALLVDDLAGDLVGALEAGVHMSGQIRIGGKP